MLPIVGSFRGSARNRLCRSKFGNLAVSQYAHRKRQHVNTDDKEIVSALRMALAERIGQERFELWFGGRTRLLVQEDTLRVIAPDRFLLDRLRTSFRDDLSAVCHQWLGSGSQVKFLFEEQAGEQASIEKARDSKRAPVKRAAGEGLGNSIGSDTQSKKGRRQPGASGDRDGTVRRVATLDNFVTGDSNLLAYTGVRTVAESPGRVSPLFLYGPSGTGKTHLLEAVAAASRRERGIRRVVLLSAEQFTSSFLEALRGSGLPNFRRKYRDVEVLLIDDLHFFTGKPATLVELLHTVDSLLRKGRQLVFSANRPPSELAGLGSELLGRISGGLVTGIEQPDEATRLGIARELATMHPHPFPEEVLQRLACQLVGDARMIAGALNRLAAASRALSQPIGLELAEQALSDLFRTTRRVVQLSDIESAVCEVFGVDVKSLQSGSKSKVLSQPRMLAMWLARKHTRAAFAEIGQYFGRRSHSTVISAQKKVEGWVSGGTRIQLGHADCDVRNAIRQVENRMTAG